MRPAGSDKVARVALRYCQSGPVVTMGVDPVVVFCCSSLFSPPPLTLTLLTRGLPGTAATLTVSVMALPAPPAAITALDVQVTTCPAHLQAQPVPVPDTYVKPIRSVSVTVIVPAVA